MVITKDEQFLEQLNSGEMELDDNQSKRIYGKPLYEVNPDKYIKNTIKPQELRKAIKRSGWSIINLNDIISDGSFNLYRLTSTGKNKYNSVERVYITRLCYYLQVDLAYLTGQSFSINQYQIPKYANSNFKCYYFLKGMAFNDIPSDVLKKISSDIEVPMWILKKVQKDWDHKFYISQRLYEMICKKMPNYVKGFTPEKYLVKDDKKFKSYINSNGLSEIIKDTEEEKKEKKSVAVVINPALSINKAEELMINLMDNKQNKQKFNKHHDEEEKEVISDGKEIFKTLDKLTPEQLEKVIQYCTLLKDFKEKSDKIRF